MMYQILGKEYDLAAPNVAYPALAKSHFTEINFSLSANPQHISAAWISLLARATARLELAAKTPFPLTGDVVIFKDCYMHNAFTYNNHRNDGALTRSAEPNYHILPTGMTVHSGSLDMSFDPKSAVLVPGRWEPLPVWFFAMNGDTGKRKDGEARGSTQTQGRAQGVIWVRVFEVL